MPIEAYVAVGVEHVYDAFDDYEHANTLGPVAVEAADAAEAYEKGERALQVAINKTRAGFMSDGSFVAEVIRIVDHQGRCVFQRTDGLRRYWGGRLEDASGPWADERFPFWSCFLCYSHRDEAFAARVYDDLRRLRFDCWFAPVSMSSQEHLERVLRAAIDSQDRFLVAVSGHSVRSAWVAFEVNEALRKEDELGKRLVFPLFLDSEAENANLAWVKKVRRRRSGVSFAGWRDQSNYSTARDQLIRDLAASI